jgi:hypothetical protein
MKLSRRFSSHVQLAGDQVAQQRVHLGKKLVDGFGGRLSKLALWAITRAAGSMNRATSAG